MRRRAMIPLAGILLALVVVFDSASLRQYFRGERPEWRAIAEFVHRQAKSGETVLLANNWVVRNFGWYWHQLPRRQDVSIDRFVVQTHPFVGPAWIVTGQCWPRSPLESTTVVRQFPMTEMAEVRYLPAGASLSMTEELCPE